MRAWLDIYLKKIKEKKDIELNIPLELAFLSEKLRINRQCHINTINHFYQEGLRYDLKLFWNLTIQNIVGTLSEMN